MSTHAHQPSRAARQRILLVEDTVDTRQVLKLMLEWQGYEVLEADSGGAAVEMALREHPDAVIMDMSLPGLDGCEATKLIRRQPGLQGLPIIACTAHNRWEWRARAIVAGCSEFVEKPIDFDKLLLALLRHLRV